MNIMTICTTVGEWITLITLIVGLIGAIAALVPTAIKCIKALKELAKNKNWKEIYNIAMTAMTQAQESGKEGAEKKQIVIDTVKATCAELGIEITEDQLNDLATNIDDLKAWFQTMKSASNNVSK